MQDSVKTTEASAPDTTTDVNTDAPMATKAPISASKIGMIVFAVFNFLGFIGIITAYFVFITLADNSLREVTEICDNNADGIKVMEDVPVQLVEFWAYNLTNPNEYLNGGNAEVHEIGVYGFNFQPTLNNIEVTTDLMEFDLYNADINFNGRESCDTCDPSDKVFAQFTAYNAIMGAAKSEAVVMLSMSCTPMQIGLISSTNPAIPYCEPDEMRTGTACRCCAGTPTVNATTCSDLASTSSKNGGLMSWIAKYDGGMQLSDTANANFPLSTGDYSDLVRETNVQELVLGTSTSMVGFFQMNKALLDGATADVLELAKTTNDLKDACTPLNYCPTMNQLLQQISTAPVSQQKTMGILRSIDCSGLIPSATVLEDEYGLEHSRAQELRYLEGTNCRPYGLTLAISTLVRAQQAAGATHTCADSSHQLPCCMSAFSAPALGGAGQSIGCLGWAPGMVQSRNLYSVEEATQYIPIAPHAQSFTACAEESIRFRQEMWHGRTEWNNWFTPDDYTYPNMKWADYSMVSGAASGAVSGQYTVYDIDGTQMALRKGRGITTGMFEYDLTDGKPLNDEEQVWAPFRLDSLDFKHDESFRYQELQVALMKPAIQTAFTDSEIESRQKNGEMPYPNQKNVAYSRGVPVVVGYPNFYKVNEDILSQSSNAARLAPDGAEIQLYRTRAGYDPDSEALADPARITTASLNAFADDYGGDIVIEPASGIALDASVVTMISNFAWQCDPRLDTTCRLVASAYNASDPQCYIGSGMQMPCSVANVFTPKVHGGKLMPSGWIRSLAVPSADLVDVLLGVSDTRYALSFAVVILPVIFAIGFVYSIMQLQAMYAPTRALQHQSSFGEAVELSKA